MKATRLTLFILFLIFINCSDDSKTPLPTVDPQPVDPENYTIKPEQVEGGKIVDFEISIDMLPYTFGIQQNLDKVFVGFKNVLDTHFEIKTQDVFMTTIHLKETLGQGLNSNLILTPIYEDAKTTSVKTISNIDIEFKVRNIGSLGFIIFTKDIIPDHYEITSLARVNFDFVNQFGDALKNARKDIILPKGNFSILNGINYEYISSVFSEGEIQVTVAEMDSVIINKINVRFEKELYKKTAVRDSMQKLLDNTYSFFKNTDAGDYLNQIDILYGKGRNYNFSALGGLGLITLLGVEYTIETMIHEMGHVWEIRPGGGSFLKLHDNVAWKNLSKNHFVTSYGATNINEYFADSFMLYFYEKERNIAAEQLNQNPMFDIPIYILPKEVRAELDKYFMK